MLPSTKHKVFD